MKGLAAWGRVCTLFGLLVLVFSVILRASGAVGPFGVQATNIMFFAEAVMIGGIALILSHMSLKKD